MIEKKKLYYLIAAFFILFIFYFIPNPKGLSFAGKMMIGTLIFGAILFITEALPLGISGLLIMIIPPILGIFPADKVFALFGNEAVFFLIGAFILAAGIQKSGIHKRFASYILRAFGKSSRMYVLGILIMGSSLSFFISEHAVVVLLLPIVGFSLLSVGKGTNMGKAGMLSLTYGCTAGSVATLMGGARNPYTVAFLAENYGIHVTFLQWIIMAMPVTLIMIPVLWFIIVKVHPPEDFVFEEKKRTEKMSRKEWEVTGIIILTIALLITMHGWSIAVSVIIGAALLFVFNITTWKDVERSVPWGVILLYGGAMTLGAGLQISGASSWIAENLLLIFGTNQYLILIALIVITIMMTEIMSHAAAVALMLPIGTGIAAASGMSVLMVAMAIALAGGFGYALLVGTPGNIITYSTGYFKQRDILKTGIIADSIGVVVVFFVATFLWKFMGVF